MADRDRLGSHGRRLIGQRVRRLRGKTTLEALAERAGISSGTLGQIERGGSDPSLGTLLRLMHALGLGSIEDLLGDVSLPSGTFPVSRP